MINADVVRAWRTDPGRQKYANRDVILYALGAGAGASAEDLPFVYEAKLKALPTMAVVLAGEGFWMRDPKTGIDWKKLLHGEQRLSLHRALPSEGEVVSQMKVTGLYDRGAGKGAALTLERELRDAESGDLIAVAGMTAMLMGDGGFGGSAEGMPKANPVPERAPDMTIDMETRADQALIYRLSGDYNPLHIDPEIAQYAGFDRPILHGLCSYAIAGRAILRALCNDEPDRLKQLDVRFSSPVFPGETLSIDIWREGEGMAAFRARVAARNVTALNNGFARFE
ncbi:MAG: MaoC/PaaZ C-terminal domain-containing protein [Hyphomonadaceae bacterium]